jgi:hypothetical protein
LRFVDIDILITIGVVIFLVIVVFFVGYEYKIITGKSEYWKKIRNGQNLQNAFSQGEFKTFEILSGRKERSNGKDKTE